jgi:hypothetical protein
MSQDPPAGFVIAFSSVSGGGKTTLVKKVAERLDAPWLLFDEYKIVSHYPKDVRKWVDDGADVNEWQTPQFAADVAALRRGESVTLPRDGRIVLPAEHVLIEEPMGRARVEMAPHQAAATCDLLLDGQLPADELAQQLVAAVVAARKE